jgi:hypothetical protein
MAEEIIICDTDVMVDYWNSNNARHFAAKKIIDGTIGIENIALSAITKMELMVGGKSKSDLAKINKNLAPITVALLNNEITITAFSLLQKYTLSHGLQLADAMIAATAIVTNLPLFTYNVRDYQFISELTLFGHEKK